MLPYFGVSILIIPALSKSWFLIHEFNDVMISLNRGCLKIVFVTQTGKR